MLTANNISVVFPSKKLFENVNIKFTPGNCYGIIGANGAGKSTFLKVLAKEYDSSSGDVVLEKGARMSVLKQDHFAFDELTILKTVVMGHKDLYAIMTERDELYAKADFTEEDGYKAAELEEKFADLNGWEADSEAEKLLNGLNLEEKDYSKNMSELAGGDKVKVLLAQALFGDPDLLILDEPTNHLDFQAIKWLEDFLIDFDKTIIVVSHDRHFLNNVCTHIVDIDYGEANLFVGNYDFWRESSELAQKMKSDVNAKKEEKIKELEDFIARFSANASKSKQATSRKKALDKITLDDIKPSSRKYPYIHLPLNRDLGRDVISADNLNLTVEGEKLLTDISFEIEGSEKAVILSRNEQSITALFQVLNEELTLDSGEFKWGTTVETGYFPKDHNEYFDGNDLTLVDWLRQYSPDEQDESFIRGFLGKMLFSGEDAMKKANVLSGGEKMRMMFSKLMLDKANVVMLDQPTNHLDLESIQSVNEALERYEGSLLFSSHDYSFIDTVANKVIELTPKGAYVFSGTLTEYLEDEAIVAKVNEMYSEE